jgi:two-component system cell cycle response regulator
VLPLILIIDDEEDILQFLERVLSKKYSILKAPNGEAALKILKE